MKPKIVCLNEIDHWDELYMPELQKLGYEFDLHWRRGKDAEVIAWDK